MKRSELRFGPCGGLALLTLLITCLFGCQKPLYSWGSYQQSILRMYEKEGTSFNSQEEIAKMSREMEEAATKNELIPPGKHAHVGYLCFLTGDSTSARTHFESEKSLYPESAVFMNYLLARLK